MPEFKTPTGTIFYQDTGPTHPDGTVLLLHNFMSSGRLAWGAISVALAERYRVIRPDLPGHVRSVGYPPAYDHRAMAGQLADLVQALGVTRIHLAGVSGGGIMAEWMVQDGLVDAASLTLISTTYSTSRTTTGAAIDLRPEAFNFGDNWLPATARLHDPHQGEGYFDGVMLPAFRALTPTTTIDLPIHALMGWELPVCIIHGAQDELFPVEIAEQMAAALPQAELHIIPDQGHALIFRANRKVGEILQHFLAAQTAPA